MTAATAVAAAAPIAPALAAPRLLLEVTASLVRRRVVHTARQCSMGDLAMRLFVLCTPRRIDGVP
jgi:hypothetical protein